MAEVSPTSTTSHFIASLYHLTTEARDEVIRAFELTSPAHVTIESHNDMYFVIECPIDDDKSPSAFSELLRDYIKLETEKEPDLLDKIKVTRVEGTSTRTQAGRSSMVGTQTIVPPEVDSDHQHLESHENLISPIADNGSLLINHETVIRAWNPERPGGLIDCALSNLLLQAIGSLCNARLENAKDSSEVLIRGDNEQDVDKAMLKLTVIDETQRQPLRLKYSFPVLEGQLSVTLQMTALGHLDDRRVVNTLLPGNSPLSVNIRKALVVSMVRDGFVVAIKQPSQRQKSHKGLLWKDHPYKPYGNSSTGMEQEARLIDMIPERVLGLRSVGPTEAWVRREDPSGHGDPFEQPRESQELAVRVADNPPSPPQKQSTKRSRAAKGATKVTTEAKASIDPVRPQLPKAPTEQAETTPAINNTTDPPTIEPPYMPPSGLVQANASSDSSMLRRVARVETSQPTAWEETVVGPGRGGLLIDVQGQDSSSRRDTRRTMRQKKASLSLGSNSEMLKGIEQAASSIMELARPRPGPIRLEAGLGRFLVNPETASAEYKRPFPASRWSSAFSKDVEVNFTPQLTTHSSDIGSILDMKMSQSRLLFDENPQTRSVTYVISCLTELNDCIKIEVSEDGSFQIKGQDVLTGTIDLHFPLRSWDCRLQLKCQELFASNYRQQAQVIVDNMKLMVEERSISFSTTTGDSKLKIKSVLLRRETTHTVSTYPDLLLHLEEMQDLAVEKLSGSSNRYHGSIQVPRNMIAAGRLWWQASITSMSGDMILKANETLELGEVAEWSPEDIIAKGVLRDLCALTEKIVTAIDHVGHDQQWSKTNSGSKVTGKTRTDSQDILSSMGSYW